MSSTFNEKGALLFLDGQFALRYAENGGTIIKFVAPQAVRAAFNQIPVDSGWLPPGVRRWGYSACGEYAVACFPAQRYRLTLMNDSARPALDRRFLDFEVPLPALAFAGIGSQYYVWAIAQDEVSPEAPIKHAPLPNVGPDGGICFGDNQTPPASIDALAGAWKLFITTPFSGHNSGGKSRRFPDDVRVQLLRLAHRNARRYPLRDLVGGYENLEQVVDRVIKKSERDG